MTGRKLGSTGYIRCSYNNKEYQTTDEIEEYITNALTSGLLDKKTINKIESML
ncbi:MAG: hypothetical protein ACOX8P_13075 [Tepidanaerobacteraceae bacterium]|jgi:hypothetical protein